jgi:rhamnose transport system ATP-binding protein
VSKVRAKEVGTRLSEMLKVRAISKDVKVIELSGGNQQKVVIAKWLATRPKMIILDEPTKGIDIGSKAAVHDFIGELAEDGLAVVLISSELPEVMGLADRVIVMKEGRMVEEFRRGQWSAEEIVGAATGARKEAA